jgi:hypothetical protein
MYQVRTPTPEVYEEVIKILLNFGYTWMAGQTEILYTETFYEDDVWGVLVRDDSLMFQRVLANEPINDVDIVNIFEGEQ